MTKLEILEDPSSLLFNVQKGIGLNKEVFQNFQQISCQAILYLSTSKNGDQIFRGHCKDWCYCGDCLSSHLAGSSWGRKIQWRLHVARLWKEPIGDFCKIDGPWQLENKAVTAGLLASFLKRIRYPQCLVVQRRRKPWK